MSEVRLIMLGHLAGATMSIQRNRWGSATQRPDSRHSKHGYMAEKHGKTAVIPGMEPTGHYWFALGKFLQDKNEAGACKSPPCEEIERTG